MEGGAMRGMFTCGVIDVMMENGIEFDGAIGVSAGAVFGCNYKSKQIGRGIRYNKRFCSDPRYGSFRSFLKTGDMFDAEFCYKTIPDELDVVDRKTFRENPMEFHLACTDVVTGKPVYHQLTDAEEEDIRWLQASASIPLLSRVVEVGGYRLLDGGMADPIPVRKLESLGYDRNVVILTQPLDFVKKKAGYLPMAKLMLGKYPNLIRTMANRHNRYNETTAYVREKELRGELLVIRPPEPLNIKSSVSDPNELERVYQIGRRAGAEMLEQVKAFLK